MAEQLDCLDNKPKFTTFLTQELVTMLQDLQAALQH